MSDPSTNAPVRVRQAVPADAPALHALVQEAMRLYAEASGIPGTLESLRETEDEVRAHILADDVFVAEYLHEGRIEPVGTLRLSPAYGKGVACLSRFAVAPDVQRIGVGGALLRAVDEYAAEKGLRRIRLHTALSNLPLVRFYQARGFRVIDAESTRGYPRGRLEKRYPG